MALTATQSKSMYQFFALAFNAAPGVTYMNQLDSALNSGMSVTQVVEAFTSKAEFTSSYPGFLSNSEFATKFINKNVGAYATDAAKTAAINDITAALNAGWSRGKTITQVFTNITALSDTDATWGTFVKLINNEVAYAKYYTETLLGGAETIPNLTTLRAVLSTVTPTSVVTDAAIAAVLNPAPVPVNQTFTLTTGSASIDEGGAATFLLSTTNVQAGSSLGYKITGTGNAADKSAFGTATVDSNGKASISIPTSANTTFGDTGTLKIELLNGAANSTVVVNDRSVDPQIAIEAANVVRATSALADYTAAANAAATTLASAAAANAAYDAAAAGVNSVALANAAVPLAATSTAIAAAAKTAATAQATAAASLAAATAATRTTTDDAASTAATAAAAAANSAADAAVTGAATDATAASTRVVTETTEVANVVTANAALAAYNAAASTATTAVATAATANAAYDTAAAGVNSVALANAAVTLAATSTTAAAAAKTAATAQVAAAATLATAVAATYTPTDNPASTAATAAATAAARAADTAVIDAGTDATAAAAKVTQANAAAVVVTATAIAENGTAAATVFTAPDGAATGRTYSLTGTDAAFFNINASTGAVSIKAAADFETKPSYSFNVTASDGSLFSRAVTLAVTNVNEAPVMTSAAVAPAIAENGAANAVVYTATATDVDAGTTLTYSLGGTDAAFFNINASTGAVSIKAAADFEAKPSYGFSVTASDGALSATQAVTLAVTNVNEAITGVADSAVTPDNTAVTIDVLANDTDIDAGDGKTLSSVTQGANGTVTIVANKAVYTPNPTFLSGTDTFTYIAKDTAGLSTAATTVTVAVNTVNTAPVITAGQAFSVTENANTSGRSVGFVAATDQEGNAIRGWSLSGTGASNFDINQSTGQITQSATAAFNFEATPSYTLTVNAQDTGGLAATAQTITINVADVREAPVVTSGATATAIAENGAAGAVVYTATVTEVDAGTTPTYSLGGTDAAFFNINASTGAVSIINAANFEAKSSYSFNVVASSWGGTLSTSQAVTLAVTNVNETPVMTSAAVAPAIAENGLAGAVVYTATATDVDAGTTLTYSLSGTDAAFFNINASTGVVSIKLAADFEAKPSYSFNVIASDGALSATQAVTLAVTNVNETPVMTSAAVAPAIAENGAANAVIYTATATDVDAGTTLTYSLGGTDAAFFNINASTGAVSIKAAADFETKPSYGFSVTASDGALSASQAVTLAVTNVNEAPTAGAATTASVPENTTAVGTYLATDVDAGDRLTYTLSGVDAATFNVSSAGVVTFKTAPNFEAPGSGAGTNVYSFNVVATDTGGLSSTQAITATVTNVNEVITGVADSAATPDNTAVTIDVLANDTDVDAGDAKTLSSVTQGTNGTVAIVANKAVYTPNPTFLSGTDTFTYIAKDTAGLSSAATTVTVVVNTVNNAPVITAGQVFSVTENTTTMNGNTIVAFTDQEGNQANNWTIRGGTGAALFDINAFTGQISAKAGSAFDFETTKSYTLDLVTQDGQPLVSNVQTVTINVVDVNDIAPVVSSGATASIAENAAIATPVYQITSTDGDAAATNGTTTYILGGADSGKFDVSATGAVTFKASPNFEAGTGTGATPNDYVITVQARDGVNNSAARAVTISVTDVNDVAPVFGAVATPFTIAENTTVVATTVATDGDGTAANRNVTYSLTGADATKFAVNATTGVVTAAGTGLSFEANGSAAGTNAYAFNVVANDGVNSATQAMVVNVSDVNEVPVAPAFATTVRAGLSATVTLAELGTTDPDTSVTFGRTTHLITAVTQPTTGGTVTLASDGLSFVVQSSLGSTTPFTFSYTVTDMNNVGATKLSNTNTTNTITVTPTLNLGGTVGNDVLVGSTAAEVLDGIGGNDTIIGGGGLDTISGGDGDDRVTFSDAAAQINGGAGNDTLVINSDAVASTFSLNVTAQQNTDANSKNSQANTVNTRGFENIDATLTSNAMTITTVVADTTSIILGSSGDTITSLAAATGTVVVSTLAGNDTITTGAAAATAVFSISGGDGNDTITAVASTGTGNTLNGDGGNDTITGSAQADTISGGTGHDSIVGSGGADSLSGGDGDDIVTGAAGNDNINGGAGADSLTGNAGNDVLTGLAGADTITGGAGNDNISGGDDADILVFADNAELIADGTVSGGAGTDTIRFTGDVGADINEASLVNTRISSVEALDYRGFAAAQRTVTLTDAAMTAQGTTTFTVTDGQYGDVVATGGLDINASALTAANSIDATFNNRAVSLATITTAANSVGDTVVVNVGGTAYVTYTPSAADAAANSVTATALGIVTAINAAAAGTLVASNNAGVISIAAASPGSTLGAITFTLANTDGVSVAITNTGASVMDNSFTGGAGADTFRVLAVGGGLTSADTLAGGSGTDTLFVTGGAAAATTVDMTAVSAIENITTVGTGLVTINNFHASTSLAAGATLTVNAASQTNALLGLSLNASNSGTTGLVNVTGGAGADTILGGAGADIINGGAGNDTITAGAGNDSLTGGEGDDDFVYASETAFSDDTGTTTTSDTVSGGAGNDTLQFTTAAATLSAAQLVNVTGIEIIDLAITASTITLTDAVVDANGGDIQQVRLTTAGTVTASALTAPNSIAVRVEAQTDGDVSITGGAGADSATFSGNTNGLLGATDAVKLGTGTDVIYVTNVNGHTAGTGAASAATLSSLVTGVESLVISDLATDQALGDVSITLNTTFTATTFTVDGSQLDAGEDLTFANNSTATVVPTVSVTGGAGADALTGGSGNDTLIGGDGIDGLTGNAGIDSLVGGNGIDTFTVATLAHFAGLLSPETVSGGAGNDILSITATGTVNAFDLLAINSVETISLASGGTQTVVLSDAVFTANGATTLAITEVANATISVNASGLSAANSVQITTSNTAVNQTLVGGAGNDTFTIVLGTGTIAAGDTITGGAGTDTVNLATVGSGTIDFTGVTGIETMTSSVSGAGATTNSLTFAAIPDALLASGITLTMNFSDRTGAGSVIMNATNSEADGKFNITTGAAADTIYGGAGADTVDGGSGNDTITGGSGADSLLGNAGDDTLAGGVGADNLTGGSGNDLFQFTTVAGSSGSTIDTITDFVTGGGSTANTDRIAITLDYNTLNSALTINPVRATTGQAGLTDSQTALSGERGQFIYDTTNSRLYVNVNADNLITSLDYSINVNAGSTASTTIGTTDLSFIITGGSGADAIYSGASFDTIAGGAGADTIYFTANNAPAGEVISGGADTDTIYITTGTTFVAANFGTDNTTNTVLTAGLVENIVITTGVTATFLATQLTGQAISVNATAAGAANLIITAADANADFTNLTFTATGGQNAFDTGVDTVTINMLSTTASRSITGTTLADTINGGTLADIIIGGTGADSITGGAGNDVFVFAGTATLVTGSAAIDQIDGGAGTTDAIRLDGATTLAATDLLARITNVEQITASATTGVISITATADAGGSTFTSTQFNTIDLSGDTNTTGTNVISITGVTGISTITGSAGIDTITLGALAVATTVTGGTGADTLSVANVTQTTVADTDGIAITVSGSTVSLITTTTALTATSIVGGTGVDTITLAGGVSNVATITGGDGIDVLNLGALHTGSVKVVLGSGGTNVQSVTNFLPGTNTTAVDGIQFDVVGSGETGAFDSGTLAIATLSTSAGTGTDSTNTAAGATVLINRINTDGVTLATGTNALVFTPTYADLTAFTAAIQTAGANTVITGGDNTQAVHSYPAVWSNGTDSFVAIIAIGLNAANGTTEAATVVNILTLVGITSTANIDASDFTFI